MSMISWIWIFGWILNYHRDINHTVGLSRSCIIREAVGSTRCTQYTPGNELGFSLIFQRYVDNKLPGI